MLATKPSHPVLALPKFLLDWPTWAAWTAPIKRPLDLRRHLRAASTADPDTWAPFRYAEDYLTKASKLAPPSLPLDCGVGILVAPPLVFVDLDDIAPDPSSEDPNEPDAEDQDRPPWVDEFLQRAASIGAYTEWSGSATGAHALVRTSPDFPSLTRNRFTRSGVSAPVGVEVYSSSRFAALTGFKFFPADKPLLNDPRLGDDLLTAFLADLSVKGAPVLSPLVLGPIHVPKPTSQVQRLAAELAALPLIDRAFSRPQEEFTRWSADRARRSLDASLSAWRFHLYGVAARYSPVSPLPLYELFNPAATTPSGALAPAHPNVAEWQEVSGYLRKPHRLYADIQRAHALVVEEQRLLALDLGEPPPPAAKPAPRPPNTDLAESWAQLGLVMTVSKNSVFPLPSSVNFIRVLTKHSHFQQYKIERNALDGTTRVNRQPLPDTLATRLLEPVRVILGMHSDPPIQAIRDAIEVVADDNAYDPLKEYLLALPPHDPSSPSYLSTWLERIGAQPDPDLVRYSRRILLGLVARALRPGCKFDYVPVFEGPTGIGKSTLVELIVTRPFHAVLSTDLHSKDARIAIRGKWGVELAEMSAFKKSDEESRKSFFSTSSDTFRPPYGRASIDVPRRCVLFGTTEDKQYLTDHRGNRRYWPIYFSRELDLKWFADHRDALFAEAKHHFDLGERFHDTTDEMLAPERLSALEERLLTPVWHQRILDHLLSLPRPHLPPSLLDSELSEASDTGFSGVLTVQYVANLHRVLDLPPALLHMSDAQLASFLRRAGYHSRTLAYRTPDKQSDRKSVV